MAQKVDIKSKEVIMKKIVLIIAVVLIFFSLLGCEVSKNNTRKNESLKKNDLSKYNFKQIVNEFSKNKLPEGANAKFVLRLKVFLDMDYSKIDNIVKNDFINMRINGNETILYKDDHPYIYSTGNIRFLSRLKVSNKHAVGFRVIQKSLAEDIMDMLIAEGFVRFGINEAPEGTYILRKDGYSIMIKYNGYHDIWSLILHKYDT